MTRSLVGMTALITGATAGIGYTIAVQLAAEGAEVVVHGRNAKRGAKTVQDIENAGGKTRFVAADVSNAADVRRLATEAGQVDANLRAPYILVQHLVPGMIERGSGSVINVTTVAASTPAAGAGIYGAGKAALELLTKLWADEIADAVTFLASPAASYVNGAVLTIGGGAQAIKPVVAA